ncbi:MAG: hypothetical protein ACOCV9_05805 [Marinilabiliaceae bacterium]
MKYSKNKYSVLMIAWALIVSVSFSACEDENDETTEDDNNAETWESYDLKAGTSYDYEFEFTEDNEVTSEGTVTIEVEDPEVTITTTIDGDETEQTYDSSDEISQNFISGIEESPVDEFLYQPMWTGAFSDQELETGANWSFSADDGSIYFEVTGTDSYADIEGYVIEAEFTDGSETTAMWETCITHDLPLPLMTWVSDEEGDHYLIELTSYSD